jgi:hypothetical protein
MKDLIRKISIRDKAALRAQWQLKILVGAECLTRHILELTLPATQLLFRFTLVVIKENKGCIGIIEKVPGTSLFTAYL